MVDIRCKCSRCSVLAGVLARFDCGYITPEQRDAELVGIGNCENETPAERLARLRTTYANLAAMNAPRLPAHREHALKQLAGARDRYFAELRVQGKDVYDDIAQPIDWRDIF